MKSTKTIVKIQEINGYTINCLFNNGESRVIDFKQLFEKWNIGENHIAYPLVENQGEFAKVKIIDGSFVWENIVFQSTDEDGQKMMQFFDLDAIVLYENSAIDKSRMLSVGAMLRQARKELGLTQTELAEKTGTSKHYISKIENEKSGIELMTLKKIVEGLGKRLQISIE
jgi:DNA-binding XRE family transcriptional regulator